MSEESNVIMWEESNMIMSEESNMIVSEESNVIMSEESNVIMSEESNVIVSLPVTCERYSYIQMSILGRLQGERNNTNSSVVHRASRD